MSSSNVIEKFGKERVVKEIKESLEHKMVIRREAALLGVIFFSIALWGSKLYTSIASGPSIYFPIVLLGKTYDIHFHHFHYGLIALTIGIILAYFEGRWFVRIGHILFGAGLGFLVDEYWLLLIFNDTEEVYFSQESQIISAIIGGVITIIYAVIAIGVFLKTRKERRLWKDLYEVVASGKAKIDI
ncbi:MAG: hypothetical protein HWN66_13985 [Candidatus Helarchaeota archaeon]|nr:hypothetical protein [Candidatus Helarchaeota archaeon]